MGVHFVALPILLVGLGILFGLVIGPYFYYYNLKEIGTQVIGKVVRLDEDDGVYWPTVQYRTPEGEVRHFRPSSASNLYKDLLNQELPILYNPKDPKQVIFLHKSHALEYKVFSIIGGGLILLSIVFWFVLPS